MATHTESQVKELQESALEHLWVYLREPSDMAEKGEPQIFVEGKGVHVTDALGNTYIDAMSGLWLKNVGYGRTEIADAAYAQMLKLTYMPMGTTTEPTIQLAEKIASITPGDLSRCFFTSGGSEAVETAMKLARAYFKRVGEPTRFKFISRKGSYHGATFGTLALGGTAIFPKTDYEPLLAGVFHGPQPNPYRCEYGGATPEECAERCANAIEEIIKFQGPDSVAAVIAEPVSSPLGAVVPGPNYWPMLREICDRYGCLLIADEVITGFGRTGKMFACEHWGITPDIMTVAKGITSGYIPMGGAITRKPISDAFIGSERVAFRHVITFGGHPVAAAASLKNIEIMETEGMVENSATMGRYLLDGLEELKQKHTIIGDVRGLGLFCGMEMVKDRQTKEYFPAEAELGPKLTQGFSSNGLILRGGDVMNIAPPLCVTSGEIDEIVSVLDRVIGQTARDLGAE
ncbi:MAG: aspartate aminotransferase family protein [Chloroflexi bacterium]|nr:aspartate aminotransferase family protein [Chloroflexota bacterium]MCI0864974.1 aspartate aminotransferase family protein [Chloroflexota bacterium]MCI0878616.1 aspartate aminotransferase family protein [Chloroflexota bacterium]MCI0894355.1 aspartate aminotransferase family protein [Chloroflexota bacterium]